MVEDSKVSLGSMQEDAKQGPLQSNSSFHRNTDTGDGVNSLHVFQDDIDIKAVGDNAYSRHCGPQQLIVEIFRDLVGCQKLARRLVSESQLLTSRVKDQKTSPSTNVTSQILQSWHCLKNTS